MSRLSNKQLTVTLLVCIACLTGVSMFAQYNGINGHCLALYFGGISYVIGNALGLQTKREKDIEK